MKGRRIQCLAAMCALAGLLAGTAVAAGETPAPAAPKAEDAQPVKAEEAKTPAAETKTPVAEEAKPAKAEETKAAEAKETKETKESPPADAQPQPQVQAQAQTPAKDEAHFSSAVLKAQSKLAMNLLKQLGKKEGPTSVVVSPSSLAAALSVIELGASDELRSSIPKVLGFGNSPMAWAEIKAMRDATSRPGEGGPLTVANALLIDQGAGPSPTVVETLKKIGVAAEVRDFSKPETIQALNAWVSTQTKGLIPSIIDKLPEDGGLVALNALHFKDQWKKTFDPAKTKTAPFRMVGGKSKDTQIMDSGEGKFRFRQEGKFVGVDLAYATEGFSIALVTTKSDPAGVEDFGAAADWLTGEGFAVTKGDVSLPRLDLSGSHNLRQTLAELKLKGMGTVTGFTKEPLRLVNAQQRVVLKLDEQGTEAAAATSISAARSVGDDYVRFVGDKPFIFGLRDARTGLILIAGYVGQPS